MPDGVVFGFRMDSFIPMLVTLGVAMFIASVASLTLSAALVAYSGFRNDSGPMVVVATVFGPAAPPSPRVVTEQVLVPSPVLDGGRVAVLR